MSLQYIRNYYRVPARKGGRIKYRGDSDEPKLGTITGSDDARLMVRLDDHNYSVRLHPTWEIEYMEAEQ